jgi:hypothetical protein
VEKKRFFLEKKDYRVLKRFLLKKNILIGEKSITYSGAEQKEFSVLKSFVMEKKDVGRENWKSKQKSRKSKQIKPEIQTKITEIRKKISILFLFGFP